MENYLFWWLTVNEWFPIFLLYAEYSSIHSVSYNTHRFTNRLFNYSQIVQLLLLYSFSLPSFLTSSWLLSCLADLLLSFSAPFERFWWFCLCPFLLENVLCFHSFFNSFTHSLPHSFSDKLLSELPNWWFCLTFYPSFLLADLVTGVLLPSLPPNKPILSFTYQ